MSFPSATIILSNSMPRDKQGMAASLVNTILNYSVSIGLGIAGTVESRIDPSGGDLLKGFRSAWYVGIGLSASGILCAVGLVIQERRMASGSAGKAQPREVAEEIDEKSRDEKS